MESESLWRSRLRWRWRGALQWPAFVALTILDALLLGLLPIAGDEGTDFVPAFLLAMFFNLLAVALVGPLRRCCCAAGGRTCPRSSRRTSRGRRPCS